MRTRLHALGVAVALCGGLWTLAGAAVPMAADVINETCPIRTSVKVDGSISVEVDGKHVGVCCNRCKAAFNGWSDSKKSKYVSLVAAATAESSADDEDAERIGDPYPLSVCAWSGNDLGDAAVTKLYDGREIRFCCGGCVGRFEADMKAAMKKVDEQIIENQEPLWPMPNCPLMPEEMLVQDGEDIAFNYVWNNRLFRVCCKMCAKELRDGDATEYVEALDKAVIKAQKDDYPIDTCVVGGGKLGDDAVDVVVGNRLIRLCCGGCEDAVMKGAPKYVAQVDEAWAKAKSKKSE